MSPEEAVHARILDLPAVTAIVGTRVWLVMLPQSPVLPCVRVQGISQIDQGAHDRGAGGVGWARVQVDAICDLAGGGNGYTQARSLTAAIHGNGRGPNATGVLGWRGTVDTMTIQGIFSMLDAVAEITPDEVRQIRLRRDYQVWFQEALD